MSKKSRPNRSFVHQFLDLYSNKGAGFAMLLLYKHYLVKDDVKGVTNILPSLRREGLRRGLDMNKLFMELNNAVGIIDGTGELRTDSSNEADQPKDEDGRGKTQPDDGSSGSREEGSS